MQNRLCIGHINVTHPENFRQKISLHVKIINETESNYGVPQKLRCPRQLTVCFVIFLLLIVLIRMYNQIFNIFDYSFFSMCSYLWLINYYFKWYRTCRNNNLPFSRTHNVINHAQKIAKYTDIEVIAYWDCKSRILPEEIDILDWGHYNRNNVLHKYFCRLHII